MAEKLRKVKFSTKKWNHEKDENFNCKIEKLERRINVIEEASSEDEQEDVIYEELKQCKAHFLGYSESSGRILDAEISYEMDQTGEFEFYVF
ncbi:hypothetical protein V6N13_025089 [Hibiscus sabdariffa]